MNERTAIGGNNPPSEIEILKERLGSHVEEDKLINDLVSRPITTEVKDDEEAGGVADYIKCLTSARSNVEKIFKAEKKPFFEACKVADQWKNTRWKKIDDCVVTAKKPLVVWNRKKEDEERARQLELARKAQEEAERLAKEAEEHSSAGIEDTAEDLMEAAIEEEKKSSVLTDGADNVRSRSTGAFSTASNRKVWVGVVNSMATLDANALKQYFTQDSIDKAIRAAIKDGVREIRGVRIFQEDKITIR